jgi:hypothetical protein
VLPSAGHSIWRHNRKGSRLRSNGETPSDDLNDPIFNKPVGTVLHLTVNPNGKVQAYGVTLKDVL